MAGMLQKTFPSEENRFLTHRLLYFRVLFLERLQAQNLQEHRLDVFF